MNSLRIADLLPSELPAVPEKERDLHRKFVLRNTDFLISLLMADQERRFWTPVAGCPTSTPESLARKRDRRGHFPCNYADIERHTTSTAQDRLYPSNCRCGDPLSGSNEPLDAVAAAGISDSDDRISKRYTDWQWRYTIRQLRENCGGWKEILELNQEVLLEEMESAKGSSVDSKRAKRLQSLLNELLESSLTEGLSLRNINNRPYDSLASHLEELPHISKKDSMWLLLFAFDKPVWPKDTDIDLLLCDLGLLEPHDIGDSGRHRHLEEILVRRQIPALHRALAGHAARQVRNLASVDDVLSNFSLTYRQRKQNESGSQDEPVAIDLFAGAGGFSCGLRNSGFGVSLAVDNDEHATDTYRFNHPEIPHSRVVCRDISDFINEEDWEEELPSSPDLIVGGPPCQSFSLAGYRSRRSNDKEYSVQEDPRTNLYLKYLKVVNTLEPKVIVLENVEGMASEIEDSKCRIIDDVIGDLESGAGPRYETNYQVLESTKYGIPQDRSRVFVIGVREDVAESGVTPESIFAKMEAAVTDSDATLRQGLSGLPRLRWGEGGDIMVGRKRGKLSDYVINNELTGETSLTLNHKAREHPMKKDRKLFEVMDPGDTAWDIKYQKKGGKWSELVDYNVGTKSNPRFKDKYRMVHWNRPGPTVVAHLAKDANNYLIPDYYKYVKQDSDTADPSRNRGITPREAARLQSFPDDYVFLGPYTNQFRQIGNAVPPLIAKYLGGIILDELQCKESTTTTYPNQMAAADD